MKLIHLLTAFGIITAVACQNNDSELSQIIEGMPLQEFYEVSNQHQALAESVGLVTDSSTEYNTDTIIAGRRMPSNHNELSLAAEVQFTYNKQLCKDQPAYLQQPVAGNCTAFLVAPAIIASAGHCFDKNEPLSLKRVVFGFSSKRKGQATFDVSPRDIYIPMKVIHSSYDSEEDFAFVLLDRNVTGRTPLPISVGKIQDVGDALTVIGHPWGIPTKISVGGTVTETDDSVDSALASTMSGNSGSPMFNERTKTVTSILVGSNSAIDEFSYDFKSDCMRVTTLRNNKSSSVERLFRIEAALKDAPYYLLDSIANQSAIPDSLVKTKILKTGTIFKTDFLPVFKSPDFVAENSADIEQIITVDDLEAPGAADNSFDVTVVDNIARHIRLEDPEDPAVPYSFWVIEIRINDRAFEGQKLYVLSDYVLEAIE